MIPLNSNIGWAMSSLCPLPGLNRLQGSTITRCKKWMTSGFLLFLVVNAYSGPTLDLLKKGQSAHTNAQYDSALFYLEEAKRFSSDPDISHQIDMGMIKSLYMLARYEEAKELIQLTLTNTLLDQAAIQLMTSKIKFREGDYDGARKICDSLFQEIKDVEGLEMIATEALNQVAKYHVWHSEGIVADSINQLALNWYNKSKTPDFLIRGNVSNLTGLILYLDGKFDEAIPFVEEAIAFKKKVYPSVHPLIAALYANIGVMYKNLLQYDRALEYLQYSLNIERELLGDDHPRLATTYTSLGGAHAKKGNYKKAEEAHTKALQIRLKTGEQHPKTLDTFEWLAEIAVATDNLDLAEEYLIKVLNGRISNFGFYNNHVGFTYLNLGDTYHKRGELNNALEQYQLARQISDSIHAKLNHDRADVHYRLGKTYLENENVNSARDHLLISLSSNAPGFDLQEEYLQQIGSGGFLRFDLLIESMSTLAKTYMVEGHQDLNKAESILGTARRLMTDYLHSFTDEQDRINLAKANKRLNEEEIRFGWLQYQWSGNEEHLGDLFYHSEASRGVSLLASLSDARAREISGIPSQLLDKERHYRVEKERLRSELIKLASEENDRENSLRQQLIEVKNDHQILIEDLEKNYPEYARLKYGRQLLGQKEVQERLDSETALIEYFLAGDGSIYAMVVTQTDYYVASLDVENLEELVTGFRASMQDLAQEELQALSYSLFKQTLDPLISEAGQMIERLVIIPDGPLTFLPFELLTTSDSGSSTYMFEKYRISYGISATLYFDRSNQSNESNSKVLAFAPKYGGEANSNQAGYELMRSGDPNDLTDLPGSKLEVDAISQIWSSNLMEGVAATETAFKDHSLNYDIIHLATHGLVDHEFGDYSKLAFAPDSINDGFLHAYELQNMDIRARMVTLSACETGVGKVEDGEGVMSMSRAFRSAGVPTVVMSLWPASDKSTPMLMKYFYQNLKAGQEKDLALNNAKRQYLETAVGKARHPFYWGGFVVIGDVSAMSEDSKVNYIAVAGIVLLLFILIMGARRLKAFQLVQ